MRNPGFDTSNIQIYIQHLLSGVLAQKQSFNYLNQEFGDVFVFLWQLYLAQEYNEVETQYTSKNFDPDIGLYYYNARWYDPELGRFTTEDPARADFNWYIYALNNPLRYIDPTGLDPDPNNILRVDPDTGVRSIVPRETSGANEMYLGSGNNFRMERGQYAPAQDFTHGYPEVNFEDFIGLPIEEALEKIGLSINFDELETILDENGINVSNDGKLLREADFALGFGAYGQASHGLTLLGEHGFFWLAKEGKIVDSFWYTQAGGGIETNTGGDVGLALTLGFGEIDRSKIEGPSMNDSLTFSWLNPMKWLSVGTLGEVPLFANSPLANLPNGIGFSVSAGIETIPETWFQKEGEVNLITANIGFGYSTLPVSYSKTINYTWVHE